MIANPRDRATYWSRMKRAWVCSAALALATLAPRASEAKCAYESVRAFPPARAHLPLNGRIVVEGYGASQDVVKEIASYHPELWSAGDRVALRVRDTNVGGFRLTQVVLVPERPLLPKALRIVAPRPENETP